MEGNSSKINTRARTVQLFPSQHQSSIPDNTESNFTAATLVKPGPGFDSRYTLRLICLRRVQGSAAGWGAELSWRNFLPASTVSVRSWLAAVRGNSFSLRALRLSTPLAAASSSARSKPRLAGRLRFWVDGGEASWERRGEERADSGPNVAIMPPRLVSVLPERHRLPHRAAVCCCCAVRFLQTRCPDWASSVQPATEHPLSNSKK